METNFPNPRLIVWWTAVLHGSDADHSDYLPLLPLFYQEYRALKEPYCPVPLTDQQGKEGIAMDYSSPLGELTVDETRQAFINDQPGSFQMLLKICQTAHTQPLCRSKQTPRWSNAVLLCPCWLCVIRNQLGRPAISFVQSTRHQCQCVLLLAHLIWWPQQRSCWPPAMSLVWLVLQERKQEGFRRSRRH